MKRALAVALVLTGCLGTTPDDRRRDEIGEGEDPGPEHNPGEPCLLCHGDFSVAGTIYLEQADLEGLAGAHVSVEDARGQAIEAVTNRAGNFMILTGSPRIDERDGQTYVAQPPEFPLYVRVTHADLEQEMETAIQREGSCNQCHYDEPFTDSVGHIYLVEPTP